METIKYYNAKPSNLTNLGQDLAGAKRHAFDTYENPEQKKARQQRNKQEKDLKEAIKNELLSPEPNPVALIDLYKTQFNFEHGFNVDDINVKFIITERRLEAKQSGQVKEFNKMINAYNKVDQIIRGLSIDYCRESTLKTLAKKYKPKDSYRELNGLTVDWKTFKTDKAIDIEGLTKTTRAIQFGNTVSDNERAYILNEMLGFLDCWNFSVPTINLFNVGWSFGARGNAQSVAFFQPGSNIISVNRNNIGSLIHEVGHYLDYRANLISDKIPRSVLASYRQKLADNSGTKGAHFKYLMQRKEIFARAFEAYCYKHLAFAPFALCGSKDDLPVLCESLENLIKQALEVQA